MSCLYLFSITMSLQFTQLLNVVSFVTLYMYSLQALSNSGYHWNTQSTRNAWQVWSCNDGILYNIVYYALYLSSCSPIDTFGRHQLQEWYCQLISIQMIKKEGPGLCFNIKTIFPGMGVPIIKVRQSWWDCLIFLMGILILVRAHPYIKMTPSFVRNFDTFTENYTKSDHTYNRSECVHFKLDKKNHV